jgi:transcriptional regulator with XRE-family HTH domain|tara:strand:+ start:3916 stop:4200 length:285 start_codon:yes stop_codon:yes gene_type:complete
METSHLYKQIGERIKFARINMARKQFNPQRKMPRRYVTQTELANALNITFQQIQKYEKAVNRVPVDKLLEISKYLNKPISYFIEQEVENNVHTN